MPGPSRAQKRLHHAQYPHHVRLVRPPLPVWHALSCYNSWLAIRHLKDRSAFSTWSEQTFPVEIVIFGFREAAEALAFQKLADRIGQLDSGFLHALNEILHSAHEPHATKAHSSW